jgi:hypothetical protein
MDNSQTLVNFHRQIPNCLPAIFGIVAAHVVEAQAQHVLNAAQ